MDNDKQGLWRNFAHTIMVITARARVQDRGRSVDGAIPRRRKGDRVPDSSTYIPRFEITLLAAAASSSFTLPKAEIPAESGGLGITIEDGVTEIQVTLQLKGFAALSANAGREARLVSSDGVIDYAFRFSEAGTGTCVLAASPEVRASIVNLSVLVSDHESS